MGDDTRAGGLRWDLLLPAVALVVGVLLVALASLAGYAFREREVLALDGRIFGIAHQAELDLRDRGESSAQTILEGLLRSAGPEVRGLVLLDVDGNTVARAGEEASALDTRRVDIFVGPQGMAPGHGRQGARGARGVRGKRGRRVVVLHIDPEAGAAPLSIRLLPTAAALVGLALVAFAALGGRLLVRQRREAALEARSRRLEALGRAGAGLAHQLRNPLATIKGSSQLLEERLTDPGLVGRARAMVGQADRMDRMLATLLDFARPPRPEPHRTTLRGALVEVEQHHPGLRIGEGADLEVFADPEHVLQIVENLVANACAFGTDHGPVEISATRQGHEVRVSVADRGPGPGDEAERLFQPYVTNRADGSGLGLPIARALAEANGGTLVLGSRPGGGCIATLTLPANGSAA